MATTVFLVCVASSLFVWDITIKALATVSYGWARGFVDRRVPHMAQRLIRLARAYVGLRVAVDSRISEELPRSFVLISNHQSVADIVALMANLPRHGLRFVAKRELMRWFPAVSWVLRLQRHALIERKRHRAETMQELDGLAFRARRYDACPVIFPEGTRSRDGSVGVFHTGAVRRILSNARLPILSVAVDGGYRFARLEQVARHVRGSVYRMRLMSLYPAPETKEQLQRFLHDIRAEISEQLHQWRADGRYA